jgi:hypothetical protein
MPGNDFNYYNFLKIIRKLCVKALKRHMYKKDIGFSHPMSNLDPLYIVSLHQDSSPR